MFGRSYQEVEKGKHGSVEEALTANDQGWRTRELIIMPSHVTHIENDSGIDDLDQMINAAHGAGFDVICATVILAESTDESRPQFANIWRKGWDERWMIPNPHNHEPEGQLEALGRDLWTWTCRTLAS